MPATPYPGGLPNSYTVNAQCTLTYLEPTRHATLVGGYSEPLKVTEINGSYHFYSDSTSNSDIANIQDVTLGGTTIDLNAPGGGQNVQWFANPGSNNFKIRYEHGGPNNYGSDRHPESSWERQIRITLVNGFTINFNIFVRGWKHLRVDVGGGILQVPDFNVSDNAGNYAPFTTSYGETQYNPAIRLDNQNTLNPVNTATPSGVQSSEAEIGWPVRWDGSAGDGGLNGSYTSTNGFMDGSGITGQRMDNWRYAVSKHDAEINNITLGSEFYHGRVYMKGVAGSGPGSQNNHPIPPFSTPLFNIDGTGGAESNRHAIFVYENIDHDWNSTPGGSSKWWNHEQDNAQTPFAGPRSYRGELGYSAPNMHPNAQGPYSTYHNTFGTASTVGGYTPDRGIGAYRMGAWGPAHPLQSGEYDTLAQGVHSGFYQEKAVNLGPSPANDGGVIPSEGYQGIWVGGGNAGGSYNNMFGGQDYNGFISTAFQTTLPQTSTSGGYDYQMRVPPLVSWSYRSYSDPVPPPGPCVTNPVVLDSTTTTATMCTANGSNDGSATVNETALTALSSPPSAPFNYTWTGPSGVFGGNTNSVTNLVPGNYSVEVIDDKGCMETWNFTITEPAPPPPCEILYTQSINYGCTTAELVLTADPNSQTPVTDWVATLTDPNGQAVTPSNLSFSGNYVSWTLPGATNMNIINGDYTYTITDSGDPSCFMTGIFPGVNVPSNSMNVTATSTDSSAMGADNGTATALVSGGTAPYNYTWSNGQTGVTATNLAPGSYTIVVTDSNNCSGQATVVVAEPLPQPLNAKPLDVCLNLDTGVFEFTDNNNYSPPGTTYPYRIAISIEHGNGVNVYPGTLASPDIFSDSDLASARTYDESINYGKNNSISIPMSGNDYISDIYKITTEWNFTGGNSVDHITVSYIDAQGLQLFNELSIKLNVKYSCAGDITSWDKTDYSIGGFPYSLTRTHELYAPVASGLPSPVQTTGQSIINNDLYEGTWTSNVSSSVQWSIPQVPVQGIMYAPLCVKKTLYATKEKVVSCYIDPCVVQHHAKKIKNKYDKAVCDRDIVKIKEYRFKYQRLIELLNIFIIGELGDCAEDYTELWKMLEITNLDKITSPDCCGEGGVNTMMIADGKGNYSEVKCTDTGKDSSNDDGGPNPEPPDPEPPEPENCPCLGTVSWSATIQAAGGYDLNDFVQYTDHNGYVHCLQLYSVPSSWAAEGTTDHPLQSPFTDSGQYWNYIPCDFDGGGPTFGCMDPVALNYDSTADFDDGSCVYPVQGCMDDAALNYNPMANVDDGSCTYCVWGCMHDHATNFDPDATCEDPDGILHEPCIHCEYGCTDPMAINFNPVATCDDGSCSNCNTPGCTDNVATNYNPLACVDDGSCNYGTTLLGCTDPVAVNYNPQAVEDGSCIYAGCLDPAADNTTPPFIHSITGQIVPPAIDDGSCVYSGSCTGDVSIPNDAFETWLELNGYGDGTIGNNIVKKEGDGSVATMCVQTILDASSKAICDFTGIANFTALEKLYIGNNCNTTIDITALTALVHFKCEDNPSFTSVDLANNTLLTDLDLSGTGLTSIDLTNNIYLKSLILSATSITGTLNLAVNENLMYLNIANNPSINVVNLGSSTNLNTLTLVATGLNSTTTIKVGTGARVTLANSLFTVANGSISTGTTFTT